MMGFAVSVSGWVAKLPFPIPSIVKTKRHTTAYLRGARDAPLINCLHGWPELSISWRHQLPVFAELGFRCVAGYARIRQSSVYGQHADYAVENSVRDIELLGFARTREGRVGGA